VVLTIIRWEPKPFKEIPNVVAVIAVMAFETNVPHPTFADHIEVADSAAVRSVDGEVIYRALTQAMLEEEAAGPPTPTARPQQRQHLRGKFFWATKLFSSLLPCLGTAERED